MDLGHVDAPDAVWDGGARLVTKRAAAGAQGSGLGGQKPVFAQEAIDAILSNAKPVAVTQIGPDAPVPPGGMIGLERLDACEEGSIPDGDRSRALPCPHDHTSSFFLSSTVSSPMNALRR